MRTNTLQRILARHRAYWTAIVGTGILVALPCNTEAAGGKNSGGTTKDQTITCKLTLDIVHPTGLANGVVDDGKGAYTHGVDLVTAQIGAEHSMTVFTSQFKKAPRRHFHMSENPLWIGYFPDVLPGSPCNPAGMIGNGAKPVFNSPQIFRSMFQIFGENHDDTPIGEIRLVNARLVITDDTGRTWTVYFGKQQPYLGIDHLCGSSMFVKREGNTPDGKGLWSFWTEGQDNLHVGYLYYFDGNPTGEVFAGVVDLPMSGTFESLTAQP